MQGHILFLEYLTSLISVMCGQKVKVIYCMAVSENLKWKIFYSKDQTLNLSVLIEQVGNCQYKIGLNLLLV